MTITTVVTTVSVGTGTTTPIGTIYGRSVTIIIILVAVLTKDSYSETRKTMTALYRLLQLTLIR